LKDKDYEEILKTLLPIVSRVEIYDIDSTREMATDEIEHFLKQNRVEFKRFDSLDDTQEYLVFGSFVVVENFLREYRSSIER